MADVHPNIELLQNVDPRDIASAKDVFADDIVFHYFNPNLPDVQGDYVGLQELGSFFETIGARSGGTFRVEPVSATAVGDELVVSQTRNSMTFDGQDIAFDVVVVWRFVDGRIVEAWDIPSAHKVQVTPH